MRGQFKPSATTIARRRWWSETARLGREKMKENGVIPGDWLDQIAAKKRGKLLADMMGRFVDTMCDGGLTDDEVDALTIGFVRKLRESRRPPAA